MQLQTVPSWKRTPFLRIIIPFICGIMIQYYYEIQIEVILTCCIILCITFIIGFSLVEKIQYKYRLYSGLLIHFLILFFGMLCLYVQDPTKRINWYGNQSAENIGLILRLETELSERPSTYKAEAKIVGNSDSALSGKVLIYFRKDSTIPDLKFGSVLVIRKPLEKIPSNHNPGGFDYSRYNALKGIYHQVFLTESDYTNTGIIESNFLNDFIFSLQKNVLNAIRANVRKEEQGLAEALLIGYKEDLDRDLLQQYSNTGVVHVIAISGLHLALIYVMIEKVCSFFIRRKNLLKAVIILSGLWIFTLLAGASPSVVRSAVMFSMIVIGETFQKRSGITNSLFASAFLLLCYNPYWLWDLGFQLSYCAVLGLALSAKSIYDLWYIHNKLLDQVWKMCSVTLAAQFFTLPILLYHFHQFPVYFLFTNFFCVPLSSLILVFEILLCAISFLAPVATIAGIVISWLIRLMNTVVSFFNELPYTTIYPIQINALQAWMITLLIGSLYFFFSIKTKGAIWFCFFSILVFSVEHIKWKRRSATQSMMIVYNAGKYRAIDLISGNHSTFVSDTGLLDSKRFKQFIEPTRNLYGVKNQHIIVYPISNYLFKFNDKRIAVINSKNHSIDSSDITIFSRNSFKVDSGASFPPYGEIIFDGTNSPKKIIEWNTLPARVTGTLHQTPKEGAFVKSFN